MKRHHVLLELCNSHTKYLHKSKHKIANLFFTLQAINCIKLLIRLIIKFPILSVNEETQVGAIGEKLILPSQKQ